MNKRLIVASILSSLALGGTTAFGQSTEAPADDVPQAQDQAQQPSAPAAGQQDQQAQDQQQTQESPQAQGAEGTGTGETIIARQAGDQLSTDYLVGAAVTGGEGEEIGAVDALLVDQQGQVTGAVLSVGGFLGLGDKLVGVSWDELNVTTAPEDGSLQVSAMLSRAQLEQAPEFKSLNDQRLEQQQQQRQAEQAAEQQQSQQQQPAQSTQ